MAYRPKDAHKRAQTLHGPLSQRLEMVAEDFRLRFADYSAAMDRLVARLNLAGAASAAPKIGDVFPDFVLPDSRGGLWHLADALKNGPVVLAFHRGYWCDFCHLNIKALAEISPQIRAMGCEIVAISPQDAQHAGKLGGQEGADFPILCDVDLGLSTLLGLTYVIDDDLLHQLSLLQVDLHAETLGDGRLMPITATFVLDRDARVSARHVDPDPRLRMDIDAILQAASAFQLAARS